MLGFFACNSLILSILDWLESEEEEIFRPTLPGVFGRVSGRIFSTSGVAGVFERAGRFLEMATSRPAPSWVPGVVRVFGRILSTSSYA